MKSSLQSSLSCLNTAHATYQLAYPSCTSVKFPPGTAPSGQITVDMQPQSCLSEFDSIASEIARHIGTSKNSGSDCNAPDEKQVYSNSIPDDVEGQVSFCLPSTLLSAFGQNEMTKQIMYPLLSRGIDSVTQAFKKLYPERATETVVVHFKSQEERNEFERLISSAFDNGLVEEGSTSTKVWSPEGEPFWVGPALVFERIQRLLQRR